MRSQHIAFARHFVEMLVAMLLGMGVAFALLALGAALADTTHSALERDEPALVLVGLVAGMTSAMVAWMRFRGHAQSLIAEMAGAMVLVAVAILALVATGLVDGEEGLHAHHPLMIAAMLGAMLLRRREYTVAPGAALQHQRPRQDAASGF